MEQLVSLLPLAIGVGLLLAGAEIFTDAAVDAARGLRLTTLAVGLLLAGAEPEELFTVAMAAGMGAPGIAIGDAIGTNTTIIGLALGTGAALAPVRVDAVAFKHAFITLLASLPAVTLLLSGGVGRGAGLMLCGLYGLYVWYVIWHERIPLETEEGTIEQLAEELAEAPRRPVWQAIGLTLLGLAMMAGGGRFTVEGARALAGMAGLSDTAVGLTLVALATSLEMMLLSIVPVLKGHPELTIGGIIGSYAYNMTLTLGVGAVVSPLHVEEPVIAPLAFMLGSLAAMLILMRPGQLGRASGLALLVFYAAYVSTILVG